MILKRINTDTIKRYASILQDNSYVKDYTTGKQVKSSTVSSAFGSKYYFGIVDIVDDEFVLGFFSIVPNTFGYCQYVEEGMRAIGAYIKDVNIIPKENIHFHNGTGIYYISNDHKFLSTYVTASNMDIPGSGQYPYKTIIRRYSANESLDSFMNMQVQIAKPQTPQRNALKYTFGMEFETCCGYIPEDLCYKYGLIPLRDGSIKGIEYSTIVLDNHNGLSLLKEQIALLDKYTKFDKDCSLHMHLGGYPIEPIHIFVLDTLGYIIQDSLEQYVPYWTFTSENYKSSHKNYCKKLRSFKNFDDLYYTASNGIHYMGSLQQPHPNDNNRSSKWNISVRYVWQNIVNMMFYRGCKTVEYRFLRPTYNFNKIINWLYIFNGILQFAEIVSKTLLKQFKNNALDMVNYEVVRNELFAKYNISSENGDNILIILNHVYKDGPKGILDELMQFLDSLQFISSTQRDNDDNIGAICHLDKIIYSNVLNE